MQHFAQKLDDALYALEKVMIIVATWAMTVAVFADVTHRQFNDPRSKTGAVLAGLFGVTDEAGLEFYRLRVGPAFVVFAFWLITLFAVRTPAEGEKARPWGPSIAMSLGLTAVGALSIWAFVEMVPEGLIWAQKLSLIMLVWVALLGASIAAREKRHLAVDAASKIWPAKVYPYAYAFSQFVTVAFCCFLIALGWSYMRDAHLDEWLESNGVANNFLEMRAIPKWVASMSVPVCFGIMALRFMGHGVYALMHPEKIKAGAGVELENLTANVVVEEQPS